MTARRTFLGGSLLVAAAAGAPRVVRAQTAASRARVIGANDRINVGFIGVGGMGRSNLTDFLKVKNVACVALCDVDDTQAEKAAASCGEQGAPRPGLLTRDFRRVLELKDVDAVVVSTPDHWHAIPTVLACEAGKDVYVEKPLATSIGEGRAMVAAARRYDRVVQVGTQQRSAPHFRDAVEYVKSGKLGKVRLVRAWAYIGWKGPVPTVPDGPAPAHVDYDMWLGPAPKRAFNPSRFHFSFRWHWDYSGGLMTDWGAHMIDIANWGMGIKAPSSAVAIGGKFGYPNDSMETPDTMQVAWAFPQFSMIWEHAIGVGRGPEGREHGVVFHGNDGVLIADRSGWQVVPEVDSTNKQQPIYKSMGVPLRVGGNSHPQHVANFIDCMRTRKRPVADVEVGHDSVIACHLGNMAFRLGRKVNWDVARETVVGDVQAQRLVTRAYRGPWRLPRAAS